MQKKKLDQVVYEYIVNQIENDELLYREHITEQYIADRLDISRTPVRKAFDRLVEDHYLENIENVGVRVKMKQLTPKDFQDRFDLFERLVNHYLFDLEKKEIVYEATCLFDLIKEMEVHVQSDNHAFENTEYLFWKEILKYGDNLYAKKMMIRTVKNTLFDEGEISQIVRKSHAVKMAHFVNLANYLEEMNYPFARREIRILFNKLKLNVIEAGQVYS